MKKGFVMKKICIFALCLMSLFFVACKDNSNSYIKNIDIESSFYESKIFLNEEIDFSSYSFTITYDTGEKLPIDYSLLVIEGFTTSSLGENEFTIKYKNKKFKKTYTVYEAGLVGCTYKGDAITFYIGDTSSLENIKFWALYEDGNEVQVSLSEATVISEVDLTNDTTNITFKYNEKLFNVPCNVTYRPIEKNNEYKFVDLTGSYNQENLTIIFADNSATLFDEDRVQQNNFSVVSGSHNKYTTQKVVGGSFVIVELYLINDTIYMNTIE